MCRYEGNGCLRAWALNGEWPAVLDTEGDRPAPQLPEWIRRAREMQVTGRYINGGIFHGLVAEIERLQTILADTEGDRPQPTSATSTLRGAADSAFAFLDSIEWTDHTSAEEAENVKQILREAIAVMEREQ
jgi:hypothetical protein